MFDRLSALRQASILSVSPLVLLRAACGDSMPSTVAHSPTFSSTFMQSTPAMCAESHSQVFSPSRNSSQKCMARYSAASFSYSMEGTLTSGKALVAGAWDFLGPQQTAIRHRAAINNLFILSRRF